MNRPDTDAQDQLLQIITFGLQRAAGGQHRKSAGMHKVATPARLVASALPRSPEIPGSAKSFGAQVQARHGPRRHDLSIDRASPATAPRAARSFAPFAVAPPQWRSGRAPRPAACLLDHALAKSRRGCGAIRHRRNADPLCVVRASVRTSSSSASAISNFPSSACASAKSPRKYGR